MRFAVRLYRRFAALIHELAAFGTIGILNFFVTVGISDWLHLGMGVGPLTSFGVGTVVATTLSYFANRYWTFRHRDNTGLGREYVLFFVLNGVGLVITWVFIGFTHYILRIQTGLAFNVAQVLGIAVATLFRFWAYKRWVFLPPTAPPVDPHTGLPEPPDGGAAPLRERPDGGTEPPTAPAPRTPAGHGVAGTRDGRRIRQGR